MISSRLSLALLLCLAFAFVAAERFAAAGEEHNFAGSAQLDYHFAPNDESDATQPGSYTTFRGFTLESALKVAIDISDQLSANVKVCYGCHGFELDMAYFDWRPFDELNLRIGRFSPSFGAFNLRHDPANHGLSDKPLPYDMGRMLRKGEWNNGVLPSPFPMNGVELSGTHWLGSAAQLDYAAYVVSGFKNDTDPNPVDLNFQESHLIYYVQAAPLPAFGARAALTVKAGEATDLTLGLSGLGGTYDPNERLSYVIGGADLALRVQRTTLRVEYVGRLQHFDTSNPSIFKYAIAPERGDFFVKHGAYAELEQPLTSRLDGLARVDGMLHKGNVATTQVGSGNEDTYDNSLRDGSYVVRETLGLAFTVTRNLRLKSSVELWEFSEADESGRDLVVSVHLGAVGSF